MSNLYCLKYWPITSILRVLITLVIIHSGSLLADPFYVLEDGGRIFHVLKNIGVLDDLGTKKEQKLLLSVNPHSIASNGTQKRLKAGESIYIPHSILSNALEKKSVFVSSAGQVIRWKKRIVFLESQSCSDKSEAEMKNSDTYYFYKVRSGGRILHVLRNTNIIGQVVSEDELAVIKELNKDAFIRATERWLKKSEPIIIPFEIGSQAIEERRAALKSNCELQPEIIIQSPSARTIAFSDDGSTTADPISLTPPPTERKGFSEWSVSTGLSFLNVEGAQTKNNTKAKFLSGPVKSFGLSWKQNYDKAWSSELSMNLKSFEFEKSQDHELKNRNQLITGYGLRVERRFQSFSKVGLGVDFGQEEKIVYRATASNSILIEKRAMKRLGTQIGFQLFDTNPFRGTVTVNYGILLPAASEPYSFKQGSSFRIGLKLEQQGKERNFGGEIYLKNERYPTSVNRYSSQEMGVNLSYYFDSKL